MRPPHLKPADCRRLVPHALRQLDGEGALFKGKLLQSVDEGSQPFDLFIESVTSNTSVEAAAVFVAHLGIEARAAFFGGVDMAILPSMAPLASTSRSWQSGIAHWFPL